MLKDDNKLAAAKYRMWMYASEERSETPVLNQPAQSGMRPENFLKGFTGCLVTDGPGYNHVQEVTRCGYWTHAGWRYGGNQ